MARMISTKVSVNDAFMTDMQSDGLIVSTPTGSTAYSLSTNGPILDPDLEALLINPICPHTLSHRPFLSPSNVSIAIQLASQEGAMATVDGQEGRRNFPRRHRRGESVRSSYPAHPLSWSKLFRSTSNKTPMGRWISLALTDKFPILLAQCTSAS